MAFTGAIAEFLDSSQTKAWKDLKHRESTRIQAGAAQSLCKQIYLLRNGILSSPSRGSDEWNDFSTKLDSKLVTEFLFSDRLKSVIGGILLMKEIIVIDDANKENMIFRYCNYLRRVLEKCDTHNNRGLISLTVQTFAECVSHAGSFSRSIVEMEIPRMLDWLHASASRDRVVSKGISKSKSKAPKIFGYDFSQKPVVSSNKYKLGECVKTEILRLLRTLPTRHIQRRIGWRLSGC